MGPTPSLDVVMNITSLPLLGTEPSSPYPSHYTNLANPIPQNICIVN